jgi:hypothetical protein
VRVPSTAKKATRIPFFAASSMAPTARALAGRDLDDGSAQPELDQRLHVRPCRARETPDLRLQAGAQDEPDCFGVVFADAREARLDARDPRFIEFMRDLQLLLRAEHYADGLLAVAQGGVIERHHALRPKAAVRVQLAHPDFVAHVLAEAGQALTAFFP